MLDRDRLEIRAVVENWVLWRDAGDWDKGVNTLHAVGTRTRDVAADHERSRQQMVGGGTLTRIRPGPGWPVAVPAAPGAATTITYVLAIE